ncbi:probable G-protein coupled receptor 139 [Liolophura sinensis]|uniref:probable G-protein coupled receptor 139 n=1 Tax=Liolophura sinensis TaxID=3198878 RepID=UPI003157FA46
MNISEFGGNGSASEQVKQFIEFRIAYYVNNSALWVLAFVGLICNLLAFITICMIKPFTNASFFVALLAVLDACVLLMKLIYQQLTAYNVPIGDLGCSITTFLGNFLIHFSTWTLVTMTIERFVAVWFPLRVNRIFTMFRAKILATIIGCLLVSLNIHFLWTYEIYVDSNPDIQLNCRSRKRYDYFEKHYWYWINSCVYAFIPCGVLTVLNALIIYGMKKSIRLQKKMTTVDRRAPSRNNQQKQVTIMLVAVSIACVCFLLPICIFYLGSVYQPASMDPHTQATYFLYTELVLLTAELNHVCNVFFYFFSSPKFRSMLIKLLTSHFRRREDKSSHHQYSMSTTIQKL